MLLLAAFNRTYLELKHVQNGYAGSSVAAFNRTYLELKLEAGAPFHSVQNAFNRTYLELKHVGTTFKEITWGLLIAPIWN